MKYPKTWEFEFGEPTTRFDEIAFGFVALPKKYSDRAILLDRSNPFFVRATATVQLPATI